MAARRPALWVLAGAAALVGWSVWSRDPDALVVYCAHDAVFADAVLRRFEQATGVPVRVRYDSEATKSLGLVELIAREGEHSPCDVFWNNEPLGTQRLADAGLLLPYRGPGFARIPESYRDPEGRWAGFGARLRVWIVNTAQLAADADAVDRAVADGLAAHDLSRVALAKPLWGTTRAHYTVLWHALGGDAAVQWHRSWRKANVREVTGNATVKDLVAAGTCALGLTDTDDYFVARDAGAPVAMVPARVGGRVLCIPNTVAILAGTERAARARALADFLLSAETEVALARSRSRQVPLGPVEAQTLPDDVRGLRALLPEAHDLRDLGTARSACLDWLRGEYVR